MPRIVIIAFALISLAASAGAQGSYSSWSSAVQASRSAGVPVVAIFEQHGCPDCARMNQALASSRSRQALRNVVKVRLEYRSNQSLAQRLNISATPTLLVFAPGRFDDPLFSEVGAMSVDQLVSLGRSLAKYSAPPETEKVRKPETTPPAKPSPESNVPRRAEKSRVQTPTQPVQQVYTRPQRQRATPDQTAQAATYYYY